MRVAEIEDQISMAEKRLKELRQQPATSEKFQQVYRYRNI